jgi:branched-chain amino acid transport system permease protein
MRRGGFLGLPAAFVILAVLGLYGDRIGAPSFIVALGVTMLFWVAQSTSWNLLSGFSGYFSFGQAAYVGLGAYTVAVLYGRHQVNIYLALLAAAALSAVLATLVGAVAFRLRSLRGEIFALLTLAVPFILSAIASVNSAIDGGQGTTIRVPRIPGWIDGFPQYLFLLNSVIAIGALAIARAVQHGRLGWGLTAIRDAEEVAEGAGVPTLRHKMLAIGLSGLIGGVAGGAYALQIGFVTVDGVFGLTIPLFVIVMSVLGGRSHWMGPVVGAALIVTLQDRLSASGFDRWSPIVLGAILAVLVVAAPDGLYGRMRSRPWPTLAALLVPIVAGYYIPYGDLQSWVLGGMLLACLVAVVPVARQRSRSATSATWAGDAPARETVRAPQPGSATAPDPATSPGSATVPDPATSPGSATVPGSATATERETQAAPERPTATMTGAAPGTGDPLVECRGVARYYGGVHALEDVSLTIRAGELIGLIGPNGSGKTTLVNLLSGAARPSRGVITVEGRDTGRLAPHRVAHLGMARTYQIPRPFDSMTVRDNVAMAIMFGRRQISLANARRAAAAHLATVALEPYADARTASLTLHQRQLLEMARAIAAEPAVLLLDEALAGLNPAEIDNAVEVIRRIHASGVTIVIVEHLLRVLNQLATRLIVLDRGVLLADGEPQTVMNDPAVINAYLGRQAHV